MNVWKPGDRLTHRFNPELGPGLISAIEGRTLTVVFPASETVLTLASNTDALRPLVFRPGVRARLVTGEEVVVGETLEEGDVRLADGREVSIDDLWPIDEEVTLFDLLASGEVDRLDAFALRLEALHLAAIREADGLGSFLGGRIRIFPHQLHVAERATRADPVRWLLADEVGLGKTVEACLILNRLLRTGRADRTLVVAPATLTVQWLGELWRKYHQVFVLIDDRRLADVEKDYGEGFNPFDAYHRSVVSLEMLVEQPQLVRQAVEAGIDVLIVDEAHRLRRPPGHPGDPAYRAVQPLAEAAPHTLLLTATPLEDDAQGFFRLLQLLRPEEFPEDGDFEQRLASGEPLPPCTSATRREDIGGLPPRFPRIVDLETDDWRPIAELVETLRARPADNAARRKQKARWIRRALASGVSLEAALPASEKALRKQAKQAARDDPRVAWLAEQAAGWRDAGDKTLVFVAERETLELLRNELSRRVQIRTGLFHEELSPGQRDIEVAQFRLRAGPSLLISTECGGEGRNFEFCTRLVLFDLPWNPMVVEQRIGRLDRIGRDRDVEIVSFRPPDGLGRAIADLYVKLGLYERPLGSYERELAGVEQAVEELALSDAALDGASHFHAIIADTEHAYSRVQQAAYRELHRDPYRPELAESILARIPEDLEEQSADVVLGICEQLGMSVEEHRGGLRHSIEFGTRAERESLPGVASGSSYLGTFLREEAVRDESIDFFASGHELVEGLLAHLEESPRGRVALLDQKSDDGEEGFGLLALYKDGPQFEAVAIDAAGNERPDWAERLTALPLTSRRVRREQWISGNAWPTLIRGLAERLRERGRPVAVAAFRIR